MGRRRKECKTYVKKMYEKESEEGIKKKGRVSRRMYQEVRVSRRVCV